MQVEAIYDHGKLEFALPIKLRHDRFRLVVSVPDDALDTDAELETLLSPDLLARARSLLDKFDAIRNAPFPPDDELPDVGPEYEDRMEAMELRAEIHREQGRSA